VLHGVKVRTLSSEQLAALDKLIDLVDEADILIRAGKLREAKAKIHAAEKAANLVRNSHPKRKVASA
jgi:soluble cytochrome b562